MASRPISHIIEWIMINRLNFLTRNSLVLISILIIILVMLAYISIIMLFPLKISTGNGLYLLIRIEFHILISKRIRNVLIRLKSLIFVTTMNSIFFSVILLNYWVLAIWTEIELNWLFHYCIWGLEGKFLVVSLLLLVIMDFIDRLLWGLLGRIDIFVTDKMLSLFWAVKSSAYKLQAFINNLLTSIFMMLVLNIV